GLTYTPGSYRAACAGGDADRRAQCRKAFDQAVTGAIADRAVRLATWQTQAIASNQAALAGLVAAHQRFEQGQPLDLAGVTAQLALIRGIVDDINNAQKS
ncbi:MAG: hypothetical protein ACREQD_03565, partial [Candidatus Binataceae bacterium]